jgi:telomere stability and silencing protein Sde2
MPSKTKVLVHFENTPKPVCVDSDRLFSLFPSEVLEDAVWFQEAKTSPSSAFTLLHLRFRMPGGKGGFGSQLRAQGNKMSSKKRAGNFSSCRDLSGKRIRTTEQNQRIEEPLSIRIFLRTERETRQRQY